MEYMLLLRPAIGAVIGYITNDIAIRMLFRPRHAKYVFGIKLPFTPGIIPKEKTRIAASIGDAISKNLMNRDVIERALLSEEMLGKIDSAIDRFVAYQKTNEESLEEFLTNFLPADEIRSICNNVADDLSTQIHSALANADLGSQIARIVIEHVMTKVKSSLLGIFRADQIIGIIASKAENLLAKNINQMIFTHSGEIVTTLIGNQTNVLMHSPMKELFAGKDKQIAQAKEAVNKLYTTIVSERLPKILDAVNISKIVESRINEMDVEESEKLILQVVKKELRAIVWLGALLGLIMGCVNLMF